MGVMTYASEAVKNLFKKPVTTEYPAKPIEYPEGSRGHIEISIDDCIGCGMCVRCCPCGTLAVDKEKGTWSINRFDCIACGYCVEKCPKKCLMMKEGYETPGPKDGPDVYTKSPEQLALEAKQREEAKAKAAAALKARQEAEAKKKAEEEAAKAAEASAQTEAPVKTEAAESAE